MVYLIQYYHHKRGKQAKTLIREKRQQEAFPSKALESFARNSLTSNEWSKELEGYWAAKLDLSGSIFDNQDHESGVCSCKCTPIPRDVRSVASDDIRRRKREDKHHLRGRPSAHLQANEGY